MGRVVQVARSLTEHGAAVVLIHHPAKGGDTPRGHGGLNGALDVSLRVSQEADGIVRGKLKKNRNGSCERDVAFRVGVHELGTDGDGDPITAALVKELAAGSAPNVKKLSQPEEAALAVLKELVQRVGKPRSDGRVAVRETDWRKECDRTRRVSVSENQKSRATAFRRAYSSLLSKGLIQTDGVWVWLPEPDLDNVFEDLESL
jgi:hypothetical protein